MDAEPRYIKRGIDHVVSLAHFPALNPQTNGDRSDLACRILAVELVQLQAIVHKAVQNHTKMFRLLSCRLLFCERTTQVLAEKHSKNC